MSTGMMDSTCCWSCGTDSISLAYISAFELLNTVTPLISGIAVTKFGAARTAILATSLVVFGKLIPFPFQSSFY